MKKFMVLISCLLVMTACGNNRKEHQKNEVLSTKTEVAHTAENSLAYEGLYKGAFPANEASGMAITLMLNKDKTFTLHSSYINKNSASDNKGTYSVNGNYLTLNLENGEKQYYEIGENYLIKLDANKQEIVGNPTDNYTLRKINN